MVGLVAAAESPDVGRVDVRVVAVEHGHADTAVRSAVIAGPGGDPPAPGAAQRSSVLHAEPPDAAVVHGVGDLGVGVHGERSGRDASVGQYVHAALKAVEKIGVLDALEIEREGPERFGAVAGPQAEAVVPDAEPEDDRAAEEEPTQVGRGDPDGAPRDADGQRSAEAGRHRQPSHERDVLPVAHRALVGPVDDADAEGETPHQRCQAQGGPEGDR